MLGHFYFSSRVPQSTYILNILINIVNIIEEIKKYIEKYLHRMKHQLLLKGFLN